jgi:hypothetical protein
MSLWRYSFELAAQELEVTKKKKQALDSLYASDKISQSTYNCLNTELTNAISEMEGHLKTLKDHVTSRTQELERQVSTLELFLASLEFHHAAGDVNDETYEKQNNAILIGLEATRQELDEIETSSKTISQPAKPPVTLDESEEPAVDVEEEEEAADLEIEKEEDLEINESDLDEPSLPVS